MKSYLKTRDFSVSQEEFQLVYDEVNDWLATYPVPGNLDSYYQSDDYISHTDGNHSLIERLYQFVKRRNLLWKENLLCKLLPERGAILDIGAGTGDFVAALHKKDWEAYGVEPNHGALKRAGDKGIQLFPSLKELPVQKYKVITLWHVLEHLPDLESQIEGMKGLLDTDGFMIVAVPNYKSFDAKYYGEYWAAYDVPRHLWHFSRTSVARLFDAHGMKIVDTRPMWFDSFYVSLLSEKYKRGKQGYWRPFWIGVQSNLSALRTGEYSSLIYIITENKGK